MLEASDCHTAAGVPPASQVQARLPCTRAARGVAASEADGGAAAQPPARSATPALYEMRTYQLILGYNPVPELRSAFRAGALRHAAARALLLTWLLRRAGLPSTVSRDKEGKLVLMCYSDVGCALGAAAAASGAR